MRVLSAKGPVDLTGKLLPWIRQQPLSVTIEGHLMVPIFSTEAQLRAEMRAAKISDYSIKYVRDGVDLLESLTKRGIAVCLDPHRHEGRVIFNLCTLAP